MIEKVFFLIFMYIHTHAEYMVYLSISTIYIFCVEDVTIDKRHLFVVQKERSKQKKYKSKWGSSECSLRKKNFLITISIGFMKKFRWGFTIVFSLFCVIYLYSSSSSFFLLKIIKLSHGNFCAYLSWLWWWRWWYLVWIYIYEFLCIIIH